MSNPKTTKSKTSSSQKTSPESASLQSRWTTLYRHDLPRLARARDSAQRHWPVHLDHCFARIILDAAVGGSDSNGSNDNKGDGSSGGVPWTAILSSPAVRHMSDAQLQKCIELAEAIANGTADLDALNEKSLAVRGKLSKKKGKGEGEGKDGGGGGGGSKRKKEEEEEGGIDGTGAATKKARTLVEENDSSTTTTTTMAKTERDHDSETPRNHPSKSKSKSKSTQPSIRTAFGLPPSPSPSPSSSPPPPPGPPPTTTTTKTTKTPKASPIPPDLHTLIITTPQLTPFRQRVLLHLCQIPLGHTSTYAALATHMDSCARAVGNALRNNPFAPRVPCHRVVASGGGIGGFGGEWGDEGKWCVDKVGLLREEGVDVVFEEMGKGRGGKGKGNGKGKGMGKGKGEGEGGGGKLVVRGPVWTGFEDVEL